LDFGLRILDSLRIILPAEGGWPRFLRILADSGALLRICKEGYSGL
jgi:hypothetical protein